MEHLKVYKDFTIMSLYSMDMRVIFQMANINAAHKEIAGQQRFLSPSRPIYIELPNEKSPQPSIRQESKLGLRA